MAGRSVVRRWNLLLLCVAAFVGSATPARADVLSGVCTIDVNINYTTIGLIPTMGSFSFSSAAENSDCTGVGVPGPPLLSGTVDLDSTGTPNATTKSCEAVVASGGYDADFTGDFADSLGTFTFVGDVAGGTMVLQGTSGPTFAGMVDLVIDPPTSAADALLACAKMSAASWNYTGTLTFTEVT